MAAAVKSGLEVLNYVDLAKVKTNDGNIIIVEKDAEANIPIFVAIITHSESNFKTVTLPTFGEIDRVVFQSLDMQSQEWDLSSKDITDDDCNALAFGLHVSKTLKSLKLSKYLLAILTFTLSFH